MPTSFNETLQKGVTEIPEETEASHLQERLYKMIDYAIARHDWYEDQRNRFATIALTMLGFAGAVMVSVGDSTKFNTGARWCGIAFVISVITTSLLVLARYTQVSEADHPYRRLADIRSWYFRYIVSQKLKDNLAGLTPEQQGAEFEKLTTTLIEFSRKWQEYATDPLGFVREDLQQVFILFLLQSYRQKNLKEMMKIIKIGILISAVLAMLTALMIGFGR